LAPDTIFALATGPGRSAVAVIRLSGPKARSTLEAFTGVSQEPRYARLSTFRDPESGEVLDRGLALWFPAPRSATGEDCAEFHIHGGRAVIDAFLDLLHRREGLRPADPGEFLRRGFSNGKHDLSQIEGLADLIDAQTAFQRRQAQRLAGGALKRSVEGWRATIIEALATVEAELDFSDEGDVAGSTSQSIATVLSPTIAEMVEALVAAPAAERLRDGFTVLIMGPPNSGKSTFLNAVAQRDVAIVSDIPGTTRDLIEAHLDLGGHPVTLIDSAGVREAKDEVEQLGIARTMERVAEADLVLWLSEGGRSAPLFEAATLESEGRLIKVSTKADYIFAPRDWTVVSAKTGEGLDGLLLQIASRARTSQGDGATALLVRQRHRLGAEEALKALQRASMGKPLELVADDLRNACRALERIVGAVDVEDVLDVIFSRFCIGK
jgi:tRNA modification GTPase